jgi:deoxyribonuclease V
VPLYDGAEVIGAVVRSRDNVSPLYVSIGHKVDLETAVQYVLSCCQGYRLPETTRQAHLAAGRPIAEEPEEVQGTLFNL